MQNLFNDRLRKNAIVWDAIGGCPFLVVFGTVAAAVCCCPAMVIACRRGERLVHGLLCSFLCELTSLLFVHYLLEEEGGDRFVRTTYR